MPLFVKRRDRPLADLSDEAIRQLTKLLYMDTADYFGDRARDWLARQEQQAKWLDDRLLRPKNLFTRFVFCIGGSRFCSEESRLCPAHMALDPNIIRGVLQLVADECTIQTNRYRSLRLKKSLSPSLESWVDGIDEMTAFWLGEDRFRRVFGCRLGSRMPDCVLTKCEACILAVIGGSTIHLTDLRASVLARQAYRTKMNGRECRTPRLLRVISSWISFFQEDCQEAICDSSEAMVSSIVEMRTLARRRRDKAAERRRRKGKMPKKRGNRRARLTEEGLPIPRQPRLRKGDRERLARNVDKGTETLLSLQETVVEKHEQESQTFRRRVPDEAHDPMRFRSLKPFTQKIDDIAETMMEFKPEEEKQIDSWENRSPDENKANEGEHYAQGSGRFAPEDGSMCKSIYELIKLGLGTRRSMSDTTSSWTSKIEQDSPCRDGRVSSRGEAASSVYSCDEPVEEMGGTEMPKGTLSLVSGLTCDSAAAALLGGMKGNLDVGKLERKSERERKVYNKTALEMLEGRADEEDAASCYEAMGWGGPRRR
ncbi:hypothetical protein V8C35DRAFT_254270 [Trichoderma chlorosporum]